MDVAVGSDRPWRIPTCLAVLVIGIVVLSRSSTSILTPLWLDGLNNSTNRSHCQTPGSYRHIDGFTIMFIVTVCCMICFGLVLLITWIFCPYLITDNERSYDKKQFALIGLTNTLSSICFVYASSGCRTAPYLQSIAANFAIPVTFVVRFLVLRKRPTCRKLVCAMLVLFAEFTALLPDIFPDLESQKARTEDGGATGFGGFLWPLCFFFGFVPMALMNVTMEKAVQFKSQTRRHLSAPSDLNIAYILFWSYFFDLLWLVCLFWTDVIPGFGMSTGVVDFIQGFWFNIKCFLGYEGCHGLITLVSILCLAFLFINRLLNSYFVRYLEGANYLAIINSLQTPLVFLFYTLFDEDPVRWHPHAYLSTWLSVAALCIMLPAIYIYSTGDPEIVPPPPPCIEPHFRDNSQQTEPLLDEWPIPVSSEEAADERTPLFRRSSTPVAQINYNSHDQSMPYVCFHQPSTGNR